MDLIIELLTNIANDEAGSEGSRANFEGAAKGNTLQNQGEQPALILHSLPSKLPASAGMHSTPKVCWSLIHQQQYGKNT